MYKVVATTQFNARKIKLALNNAIKLLKSHQCRHENFYQATSVNNTVNALYELRNSIMVDGDTTERDQELLSMEEMGEYQDGDS